MAYRPTEKTKARQQAQHQLLLSSAITIVAANGFSGLTMAAVAKQANVATGTVYKYFENKADLCKAVFEKGSGKEVAAVKQAALENLSESCTKRLSDTVITFSQRAIAGKRLAYALIAEPAGNLVEAERLTYRQAYADVFASLLAQGMETGEFYPQDANIAAAAIVGMLAEMLVGPLSIDENRETDALISQIDKMISRTFVCNA